MTNNTENGDIEYIDIRLDEDDRELTKDDFLFGSDEEALNSDKRKKNRAELKKRTVKEIYSYVIILAAAFLIAFSVNKFVIINAHVPSGSMEPTVNTDDKLIGLRLAYLFKSPARYDVVIFKFPDDESQIFIKRVIGLPGDSLIIVNGNLFINGELIEESYLKQEMTGDYGPYEVPEGCYFVMGDNRNISEDSRFWKNTFVKKKQILAKAWFRYSPSFGKI